MVHQAWPLIKCKVVRITIDHMATSHYSSPDCDVTLMIPMYSYGELRTQDEDHAWVLFWDIGFAPIPNKYIEFVDGEVAATGSEFGVWLNVGEERPISIAEKIARAEEKCK